MTRNATECWSQEAVRAGPPHPVSSEWLFARKFEAWRARFVEALGEEVTFGGFAAFAEANPPRGLGSSITILERICDAVASEDVSGKPDALRPRAALAQVRQ